MWAIYIKEANSFLNSLIGYIVIGVFLTGIGLLIWLFPETNVLDYGFADLETLFTLGPFVLMFLIPAITMRTLAEEKKQGTLELLLTRPLTDWQIILGKYFSSLTLVVFALAPTLIYYFSLVALGSPPGNIDTAGVMGSYLGLFLLGGLFTALGLLASSITENQIVAFILAVFLCFIAYQGFSSLAAINVWGSTSLLISQIGITYHYDALSRGLIDTRDVLYFVSAIVLMLTLTHTVIGSRRW
ncbi:MAG TPA: gliding motility-associated ABC transporter permease subunit GldF [Cytophagales bacterium]|nr:gliding motility-associated ABC transporter permease subunit GldF [Cytophagales bacterium]HAA23840.1 gliding motility-associated ABC transporter permease subunit GldF [Cytophagales bacterium]HAP58402.1 gliding motility-associated ABC transporter permease subunit GldF [Cytophagales bacterium]